MSNVIYVSIAAIAILLAGVVVRPSPSAIVSPAAASATIDPYALQQKIDVKALPEQTFGDLV